ncbi:MAG: hypothetical protein ACYSUK_04075 [Planctomycetota bacterium]|jgi:hypothetical protein
MKVNLPTRACPGKEAPVYALETLNSKVQHVTAIKGHGQCLLKYQTEDKKEKLNFPIKLWAQTPGHFYLQGNIALDARALIVGSNDEEFWLSIKPKEISGYWWGKWDDGNRTEDLLISPKMLLEVLGITPFEQDHTGAWTLSNDGVFDILNHIDASGKLRKKVYVYCCDYTIRKIEYFDVGEELAAVVELGNFKKLSQGFVTPTLINIISNKEADPYVEIYIRLSAVSPVELNEKQQQRLFVLPPTRGFGNIYRIIDGQSIEQY